MIKVGIECESIEGSQSWGVGREVSRILQNIAAKPELKNEFKFFLYFKSKIPNYPFLDNPIFVKKIVRTPFNSFSLYYYLLLPIKLWFEKLDIVYFPNYMLPIIYRGRSLVALTEDVYHEIHAKKLPLKYRLAYGIFANWAAKHATGIMAFSESSKKAVSRHFKIPAEKIFSNLHGIDIAKAVDAKDPQAPVFLLYVGQAFPRRHLQESILAFEKISSKFPELQFITIGVDKYRPPIIKSLIHRVNERNGRKIYHKDYVTDEELFKLYANAQALVYVSSQEAFGLPPLEALSYGTPAVVAKTETTKELFGDNAFFVANPDSVDSIAEAMTEALTNEQKRQQITVNSEKVLGHLNWAGHTGRFLNIIRKLTHA